MKGFLNPLSVRKRVIGQPVEVMNDYKIGVQTRWFWGDVDAMISRMFKPNSTLNLPEGFPGRISYIKSFLKLWGKNMNYEILRKDDIQPWFFETRRWLLGK